MFVFVAGPLKGATRLLDRCEISIGRDETVVWSIADPALSRRHCTIHTSDGVSVIKDLESLNGTFVNGVPIIERTLEDGDRVRIGDSVGIFVRHKGVDSPQATAPDDLLLRAESTVCVSPQDASTLHSIPAGGSPVDDRPARDLKALLDLGSAVQTVRRADLLQQRILDLTMQSLGADSGALLLAEGDAIVHVARQDVAAPLPVSDAVARRVIQERSAILSSDVSTERDTSRSTETKSFVCAPLAVHGQTIGAIYLASRRAQGFNADDLRLLVVIASIGALGLQHIDRPGETEPRASRPGMDIGLEHDMVGDSGAMRDVYQAIRRVAPTTSTVLIRGESGTGKELAARAIHANSPRASRPFVPINCSALTDTLLESELFGHEKGAFTGAFAQKRGKLENADGGTLFLDEVGELAAPLQVKLLRVLQEREFERVGGTRPIKVDIRLIAATNRDLEAAIKSGGFRSDLYYRLNVVSLTMPPLRERQVDISLLANYFIRKYSERCNRRVQGMSFEARATLMGYLWPGNVRELENAIERAVVMGSADRILQEDLPESILESASPETASLPEYHATLNEAKRRLIINAVERSAGNYTEAARLLGVHPNYLHRLIKNLELRQQLRAGRPPHTSASRPSA